MFGNWQRKEGKWFAWRPVKLREGHWIWLSWVHRVPRVTEYADTRYGDLENKLRRQSRALKEHNDDL